MPARNKKSEDSSQKKEKGPTLYDGAAAQRIPLEITEGSEKFETAHNVAAVSDARHCEFIDAVDVIGWDADATLDEKKTKLEEYTAQLEDATRSLWKALDPKIENVEADGDVLDLIEYDEIDSVIQSMLNVEVVEPEGVSDKVRQLSPKATVTIRTRALFSGKLLEQSHEVRRRSTELRKKYDQIFEVKDAKASARAKAKNALYLEIAVKTTGFKGKVPMRFTTLVVDHHFRGTTIDPKK